MIRFITIVVSFVLTLAAALRIVGPPSRAQASPAAESLQGECNGDGVLTTADVTCTILCLFDLCPTPATTTSTSSSTSTSTSTTVGIACGNAPAPTCSGDCPSGQGCGGSLYICLGGFQHGDPCSPSAPDCSGGGVCEATSCICLATTTMTSTTTTTTFVMGCLIDTGRTVIDTCNGREWEKKDGFDGGTAGSPPFGDGVPDASNLHDVDNEYSWAGTCSLETSVLCQPNATAAATCTGQTGGALGCAECGDTDGVCIVDPTRQGAITTVWDWLNQVNETSFAGHTDWRLATVCGGGTAAELELIADSGAPGCGVGSSCIDSIFGPTVAWAYWSADTPPLEAPIHASVIDFSGSCCGQHITQKINSWFVRAVRPAS